MIVLIVYKPSWEIIKPKHTQIEIRLSYFWIWEVCVKLFICVCFTFRLSINDEILITSICIDVKCLCINLYIRRRITHDWRTVVLRYDLIRGRNAIWCFKYQIAFHVYIISIIVLWLYLSADDMTCVYLTADCWCILNLVW